MRPMIVAGYGDIDARTISVWQRCLAGDTLLQTTWGEGTMVMVGTLYRHMPIRTEAKYKR